MTAFRWCQCRHEFLCLPVDLSERSQLALGPISVQAGRKKIWSSIMTTLRLGNNGDLRWRESSTQLLDAFCHSSDSSGPMGIGTQGGGREGWGLDPALQGQPLPQGHMGKHLAALSLFHISLYLCLRIFLCPIFFHEPPTQGCCSHCTWNIVHMTVCVCVYINGCKGHLLHGGLHSLCPQSEKFSLILTFYSCTRHYYTLILSSCTVFPPEVQNQTWYTHQMSVVFGNCCDITLPGQERLFYTSYELQL